MSRISEMYEQIKLQQYLLVKTKLEEAVKADKENRELSEEEEVYYMFSDNEVTILTNLLEEQDFQPKQYWLNYYRSGYDMPTYNFFVMKIDGQLVTMFTDDWGTKDVPTISNTEDVKQFLLLQFVDEDELEEQMELIENLNSINLEELDINPQKEEKKLKQDIDFKYLAYDLDSHEVIDTRKIEVDLDYVHVADLETVIYNILRNYLIDTKVNSQFNEAGNYCMIGEHSDMPGEEEISKILNSVDKEILVEYLKKYPADITRFESMRNKYENIQELDVEIKPPKEEFEESLLREDVVEYYLSKTPEELEDKFGKKVARMVGFEQKNFHHCYDLWEHILRTVAGIKPDGLTPEQFRKLRVAAFFHDIAKPDVSKINEKTGQQVFYGHAMRSSETAWSILDNLGYSEEEIEQLRFYIGHHDDFISYKSVELPYMKNHTHLRTINTGTILEKIIENQYDFEEMGYSKDEVRVICSTLAHDGIKPNFKDKDGKIIDVDMQEVQEKIDSGEYSASYIPSEKDYKLLLELCKADAGAQSEVAIQYGKVVGSKKEKLENMNNIQNNISEAYRLLPEKVSGYSFEQFIKDTQYAPAGVIRPYITCEDGYSISVQANRCLYCTPEEDCLENYEEYEVRLESGNKIPELHSWESDPTSKTPLYGYVPNDEIVKLIKSHGGLDKKVMKERIEQWQQLFESQDTEIERTIKEATGGNKYLETIMRYAARKIILEQRNTEAKGLLNQYEQQLNKDGQTQSDE